MSSKKLVTSAQVESLRMMANAKGVSRKAFQEWLDNKASAMLDDLKETEVVELLYRYVVVNRAQSLYDALKATGRNLYIKDGVVNTVPKGNDVGVEVEVVFFELDYGRYIDDVDLEKEYELRGLVPADPYTLSKVNEDDPAFADKYQNRTHWKDVDNNWCSVVFGRHNKGRYVEVIRGGHWHRSDAGYFAGLRKTS